MEITIIIPAAHKVKPAEQISRQLEKICTMKWQMHFGELGESAGCTYNKAMEAYADGLFLFLGWDGKVGYYGTG